MTALLAHVIGAKYVWLDRVQGRPSSMEVWPDIGVGHMASHLLLLRESWAAWLERANPDADVSYQNSKGERYSSTAQDILTHVVNHGTYHRGQIASLMRAAGAEPAYTDWIHAARQGYI